MILVCIQDMKYEKWQLLRLTCNFQKIYYLKYKIDFELDDFSYLLLIFIFFIMK